MTTKTEHQLRQPMMMNVILGVDGGKYSAWFTYKCPECEFELNEEDGKLIHPTHDGLIFKTPILCPHAGKTFKLPIQTIAIEQLDRLMP